MSRDNTPEVQAAVVATGLQLFQWMALFLMNEGGIGHRGAQKLLKIAYAVAGTELAHGSARVEGVNARRVGELTGIPRKFIAGLLRQREALAELSEARSQQRYQRIIWGWRNDRRFQKQDGTPALLPFNGPKSFSELCRLYSGDGGVEGKLAALVGANAVKERKGGRYQLMRKTFATSRMDVAGATAFGQILSEHAKTLLRNATCRPDEALYSRRIVSGELDSEAAYLLLERMAVRAEAFGDAIQEDIADKVHAPKANSRGRWPPLVFGMYVGLAEEPSPPDEQSLLAKGSEAPGTEDSKVISTAPSTRKVRRKRA